MTAILSQPIASESDSRLAQFVRLEASTSRQTPPWLQDLRKTGISHFSELGYPTVEMEDWKYTNTAAVAQLPFKPVLDHPRHFLRPQHLSRSILNGMTCHRLVFVDGHYSAPLSSVTAKIAGIKIGSLGNAMTQDGNLIERYLAHYVKPDEQGFAALNTAFFQDGAFIVLPAGEVLREPIHLLYIATNPEFGAVAHPRNLIIAQRQSQAMIIEEYLHWSENTYVTNTVTELVMEAGAIVEHLKLQTEHPKAFHVGMFKAHQDRDSRLLSHSFSLGAGWARHDLQCVLDAENTECVFNGLYLARGSQLVDHHTVIDHAQPHGSSHEFYHGILQDQAKGVFNGKIFVRPGAQKTDAKQTNRNLLLSDEATIDTKPQLEIFADDVKCTHGATVGRLNEEAIFYLRSRAIGLEEARQMLIHAFALDILERIQHESVRDRLDQMVVNWLGLKMMPFPSAAGEKG